MVGGRLRGLYSSTMAWSVVDDFISSNRQHQQSSITRLMSLNVHSSFYRVVVFQIFGGAFAYFEVSVWKLTEII